VYVARSDGSGLRQMSAVGKGQTEDTAWSPDQKFIYVTMSAATAEEPEIWRWSEDGSIQEKLVDSCSDISDVDSQGKYLLGPSMVGDGIFEFTLSDKSCIPLLTGGGRLYLEVLFAPDGKSFLYAIGSRARATFYRQAWKDGKVIGAPQIAFTAPFALPVLVHQVSPTISPETFPPSSMRAPAGVPISIIFRLKNSIRIHMRPFPS
jgi:hypothetical protein